PLGLLFVWAGSQKFARKLFDTVFILLYGLPYSALVIWLLIRFTGLQIEWRGGYAPSFTYSTTRPDYAAVERNRSQQPRPAAPLPANGVPPPYWTDFRGPQRDGHYDELAISTNWPASGLRE